MKVTELLLALSLYMYEADNNFHIGTSFSLVGCTVAPGFEFQDFELASRSKLIAEYPDAEGIIEKLTIGLP